MRLESSWDTLGSSGNSWSVAENWQPKVNDRASMRVPDANAGQAVAPNSNSAYAIRRMVASLSRVAVVTCREAALRNRVAGSTDSIGATPVGNRPQAR